MNYEEFLNDSHIYEGTLSLREGELGSKIRVQEMKVDCSFQQVGMPMYFYKAVVVDDLYHSITAAYKPTNFAMYPFLATIIRDDGKEIPCYIESINFFTDMFDYATMENNFPVHVSVRTKCEIGIRIDPGCFSEFRNYDYKLPEISTPFDRFEIMDFE